MALTVLRVGDNEVMTVSRVSELIVPYDAEQIELKVQRRRRRMRSQLISVEWRAR